MRRRGPQWSEDTRREAGRSPALDLSKRRTRQFPARSGWSANQLPLSLSGDPGIASAIGGRVAQAGVWVLSVATTPDAPH